MPINYTKAKIYKLTTPHNIDLVYYGSTVNPLYKRKGCHKSLSKKNINNCTSKLLFELGIDDVIITLVENVNCNTKEELLQRERFYIENNNCVNKRIPSRNKTEYYDDNKDKVIEYVKDYYKNNKDKLLDYQKEYKDENKEYIKEKDKEYRNKNKDKKKEYKEANKDKIKEYQREYQKKLREKSKLKIIQN